MDAREPLDPVGLRLATSTGASSGRSQTGLPLEMTCAEGAAERQAFFEAVERRFAWQAHAMTLLAGDTGFYMVRSVSNDLAQAATGWAGISKRSGRRQEGQAAGLAITGTTLANSTIGIGGRSSRAFEAVSDVNQANDDATAGFKLTCLIFALGNLADEASVASVGYCHRVRAGQGVILEGDQSRLLRPHRKSPSDRRWRRFGSSVRLRHR